MATSEIEKLERRYAENPHGLTFAPLAEVHRKNGDVARALELLTAGLELHPNYIPASIVLGRCHQDLGDLPAAEAAFAHVLRLDDENVIALKSLADISERQERFDEAVSWLRRLVSVDRSNEEAREQLHRLEESAKSGARKAPELSSESAPQTLEPVEELVEEPVAFIDLTETSPPAPAPEPEAETVAVQPEREDPPKIVEDTPPITVEKAAELPEQTAPVAAMAGLISSEFQPPDEPVGSSPRDLGIDVETSEEVVLQGAGGEEFRVPDASEDLRSLAESLGRARDVPPPEPKDLPKPVSEVPAAAAPASPVAEPEPTPQLPSPSANNRSYIARETKGQSVAQFFHALLAARPPSGPNTSGVSAQGASSPPSAEPDKKGDATVSFDDFFSSKADGQSGEQGPEAGKDDLDQFHSWLQNLKR